jgi:hypothetical protein
MQLFLFTIDNDDTWIIKCTYFAFVIIRVISWYSKYGKIFIPYVTAPLRIPRDVGNSAAKIVTTSSSVSVTQKNPGGALYRRKSEADEAAKPKDCLTQFLVV